MVLTIYFKMYELHVNLTCIVHALEGKGIVLEYVGRIKYPTFRFLNEIFTTLLLSLVGEVWT